MATEFFNAWNATLPAFEAIFGESWKFNNVDYPAIAIDVQTSQTQVMKGGSYDAVSVTIYVRTEIFDSSGIKQDEIVTVRGKDFAVLQLHKEGDECVTMICGPTQIDVWAK